MYDNPIVSPHIKPGPILWVNCQVVTMHLNHGDDYNYSKDHDVNVRRITSVTCANGDDYDFAKDHDDAEEWHLFSEGVRIVVDQRGEVDDRRGDHPHLIPSSKCWSSRIKVSLIKSSASSQAHS